MIHCICLLKFMLFLTSMPHCALCEISGHVPCVCLFEKQAEQRKQFAVAALIFDVQGEDPASIRV